MRVAEKKIGKSYGYVADFLYLCVMIEKPTYEDLEQQIAHLKARIAYLERMLFGAKSDKLASKASDEGQLPGLFDDEFKEAMEEKHCQIEQMVKEIEAEREIDKPFLMPIEDVFSITGRVQPGHRRPSVRQDVLGRLCQQDGFLQSVLQCGRTASIQCLPRLEPREHHCA